MKVSKQFLAVALCGGMTLAGMVPTVNAAQANDLNAFELETMVVTANKTAETIYDAKADISVVTRKQMEDMHMDNVETALRTVPGMQFLNYGSTGLNSNLDGLRINGSKNIVVLVDGVRMTDFQGVGMSGYTYAHLLKGLENIERIEVLRGSASTAYGSGAQGGVINIITRDIEKDVSKIDVSYGSFGKKQYNYSNQGKMGKTSYNVFYNKSLRGDVKDAEGSLWPGKADDVTIGGKIKYKFDDKNDLTFIYNNTRSDYSSLDPYYDNALLHNCSYTSNDITFKYSHEFTDELMNTLTYRKNNVESIGHKNDDYSSFWWEDTYKYTFLTDQVVFSPENHNIIMGVDYSKGVSKKSVYDTAPSMESWSYYLQDEWEFAPKWALNAGVRFDKPKSDAGKSEIESRTSKSFKLSYEITDNDTLYAGESDYFILPSISQLYNTKYGNDELQPAYGKTKNIGYNKKFSEDSVLTFNWFETKGERDIGMEKTGEWTNTSDYVSRGWNTQWLVKLDENWNANVGLAHLYQHSSGDNLSMGYYPKDMLTFGVYYDKEKFFAGLDGFYYMRRLDEAHSSVSGWPADNFGVYNLSLNYSPQDDYKIYVKVDNIFNKLWAEHTNSIHQGGSAGQFYNMPGRSFAVGMEYKF